MKLVQLNVERDRHVDRFTPFLRSENADIICLQEVTKRTFDRLCLEEGYAGVYAPMTKIFGYEEGSDGQELGPAILTRHEIKEKDELYYVEKEGYLGRSDKANPDTYVMGARVVVIAAVIVAGKEYRVGSTHFTWSEDGKNTPLQEEHLRALLVGLDNQEQLDVLTGDFNIPRGTKLYHMIAERFQDNVPQEIQTTLDQELHRKAGLQYVVDYVWSTDDIVRNVEMRSGVSDHQALIAEVL